MELAQAKNLRGIVTIPGDKSISHRAIMFGSIANGTTEVTNFLQGADCLSTIACFRTMGIDIRNESSAITIHGKGLYGLMQPNTILDVGNSGTTTRLIAGILSGQNFTSTLTGDASIQKRPMKRILEPLSQMGANVSSEANSGCAPLIFSPGKLKGIHYFSPVASAQVKSCLLLAGLYADGITKVTEPILSRNHTEVMLRAFGASITSEETTASIWPSPKLEGMKIQVPGDISSAAYFIGAGLLIKNAEILIQNIGMNPTRDGILKVVKAMGGNISVQNTRTVSGEPVCDLLVKESKLKGVTIDKVLIPSLIDEIPIIAVLAAFAEGETIIKDAAELKVKESNRIDAVANNLRKMGADVTPTDDGMIIHGGIALHGADFESYLDHRIAMAFTVAALAAEGSSRMMQPECVDISYPSFYQDLQSLNR